MDQTEAFEVIDQSLLETEQPIYIIKSNEKIQRTVELEIFTNNKRVENFQRLVQMNSTYNIFLLIGKQSSQYQLGLPLLKNDTLCQFMAFDGIIHIQAQSMNEQTFISISKLDQKLILGKIKFYGYILQVNQSQNKYMIQKEGTQQIFTANLNNQDTPIVIDNCKFGIIKRINNNLFYQNTSHALTLMQIEECQAVQFFQRDTLYIGPYTIKLKIV